MRLPYLLLLSTIVLTSSCGLFRKSTGSVNYDSRTISTVVKTARTYIGTPYKYGGMNEDGLDCSGLVNLAFQSARLTLPRVSTDIAAVGHEVKVRDIRVGDLVFFITDKGIRINHDANMIDTRAFVGDKKH